MRRAFLILFVFGPLLANAQIGTITTFAGNGTNTNTGDNGTALNAGIYQPSWGIFDKIGNYYVVSGLGHKVRKIDIAGIITTIAGTGSQGYNGDGGLADTSKLNQPGSVTVDSVGNIYIADAGNNRIRKVDKLTGIITTIAGIGTPGFSGDNGLAVSAELNGPNDMCFDKAGNLYISDANNFRIRKINTQGTINTIAGTGIGGYNGDNIAALSANLTTVRGIAIDDTSHLYIVEQNSRVRKVDAGGIIHTIAGTGIPTYNGDNILATVANISPYRVTFNQTGVLFITDFGNKRIRMIDANGIIHTIAGNGVQAFSGDGGPADSASLNGPSGITFDSCGNLYITEVNQGRIRKVAFNPNCFPASVNEVNSNNNIKLYPNPANEQLTIESSDKLSTVVLLNMQGQIVMEQKNYTAKAILDIGNLPGGIYFVKAIDKNGGVVVKRFLKD